MRMFRLIPQPIQKHLNVVGARSYVRRFLLIVLFTLEAGGSPRMNTIEAVASYPFPPVSCGCEVVFRFFCGMLYSPRLQVRAPELLRPMLRFAGMASLCLR